MLLLDKTPCLQTRCFFIGRASPERAAACRASGDGRSGRDRCRAFLGYLSPIGSWHILLVPSTIGRSPAKREWGVREEDHDSET